MAPPELRVAVRATVGARTRVAAMARSAPSEAGRCAA
jgi:hypothetical protein